jgi:uncharacterized delta-60 repeat protein
MLEDRCVLSSFGSLDPSFGQGGLVTTNFANGGQSYALVLQSDGKFVVGGYSFTGRGSLTEDFTLVRYLSSGALDSSFGKGGIVQTPPPKGAANTVIYGLALQSDGRIVGAGTATVSSGHTSTTEFELARYNANGTLDTTFAGTGIVLTNPGSNIGNAGVAEPGCVAIQSDGRIVVAGSKQVVTGTSTSSEGAIVRFNPNGTLDTAFGSGGTVLCSSIGQAGPVVIQSDGKLLVGAYVGLSLARFLPSGQLDGSFGNGGISSGNLPPGGSSSATTGVLLGSDGTIFAVGDTTPQATLTLAHFSSAGQIDTTFGSGGWVLDSLRYPGPVAFASNGDVLVAGIGYAPNLNEGDFAADAFLPNGALDTSFGTNGRVTTDLGSAYEGARGIAVQPDGRIVLSGYTVVNGYYGFALARYMPPPPQIGSFTANPNPASSGSTTTLTVSNITDPNAGASITQLAIYLDSNGDGTLDPGDTLIGYATQTSAGVWTLTYTVSLAPGTYTLFAQAQDNYGLFSNPVALTLTVH